MTTHERPNHATRKPIRNSFFRPMANSKEIPRHLSEDIELLAKPLPFLLVPIALASMVVTAVAFLVTFEYTSTHLAQGVVDRLDDEAVHVLVLVPPDIATILSLGDTATINFPGAEPGLSNPMEAIVIAIEPLQKAARSPSGVQVAVKLNAQFPHTLSDVPFLTTSTTANVVFELQTKPVMSWIAPFFDDAPNNHE